jgi:hypothetical protein
LSPKPAAAMLAVLATSALLLCGCHAKIGDPKTVPSTSSTPVSHAVPKDALERITAPHVRDKIGGGYLVITCPHDLTITLGASEQCVMAQDGKQFALTLTITTVTSPDDASWDFKVGHQLSTS